MSTYAGPISPLPDPPHENGANGNGDGDATLRQPRRCSRRALASRFSGIGPLDALALFAFEEALDACEVTPYGLPHEWDAGDARPAPNGSYCIGILGDDVGVLVSEARRVYENGSGQRHLFLGLGRTDQGHIAIACELVQTSVPRGAPIVGATPEAIARHHPWLSPTDMVALTCLLKETAGDVLLACHWSDVPCRMGIAIAAVTSGEVWGRINANLCVVRRRLECARKTRSHVVIALEKTETGTILWYGAIAGAAAVVADAIPTLTALNNVPAAVTCATALVQLPASRPRFADLPGRNATNSTAKNRSCLLVVDAQDHRDCAEVLSLYPDVSPDGLAVVFELDRALADLPRQWWSAALAAERTATARKAGTLLIDVGLSKRQIKETAAMLRDAIAQSASQHSDDGVVAVLWACPSTNGASATIGCVPATLTRHPRVDPNALALAAAGECEPVADNADRTGGSRLNREGAADRENRDGDKNERGDDNVPPLEPIPHDLFDLLRLCPRLTALEVAALSCIADRLKGHGLSFAWSLADRTRFDYILQQVETTRRGAEWAARSIVNAHYGTPSLGSAIEIGVVQREDGSLDCLYAFVPRA
ncbi:hypothetical protein pkur_cds_791 [Pandoravirus kuranda]|uniref:DUF5860 domain-containing protein n=1 Tax=Pandoravirus kuranda TaxID=3019033 RepID=A0AA95EFC2_9VIRU|nr:hypothetical protein pkur_cds_791 [Pandoravirus kuranda]